MCRRAWLTADEPVEVAGKYRSFAVRLLSRPALGFMHAMTVSMYARLKKWPRVA